MNTFEVYFTVDKSKGDEYMRKDMEQIITINDPEQVKEALESVEQENVYFFLKYLNVEMEDGYEYDITIDSVMTIE